MAADNVIGGIFTAEIIPAVGTAAAAATVVEAIVMEAEAATAAAVSR